MDNSKLGKVPMIEDVDRPDDETIRVIPSRAWVHVIDPQPAEIFLVDIAHALSLTCRFGGHVPSHYSVAEHSLNVCAMMQRQRPDDDEAAIDALFHDAPEYAIGDIVRPLKHIPEFKAIYMKYEAKWDVAVARRFSLPTVSDEILALLREIDISICYWEMAMVRDAPWRTPTPPDVVERAFTDKALSLAYKLGIRDKWLTCGAY